MITRRQLLRSSSIAVLATGTGWFLFPAFADKPTIAVLLYKNPGCECCDGYAAYLGQHGFKVTVKETEKLAAISSKAGIPAELQGCHTSFIDGYVVAGHVPIEAVQKLLAERPEIKGLALAGMPTGSPGMPGPKDGPFIIHAIDEAGKSATYMTL